MSARFKLGDRVIISGQIVKTHSDGCTRWLPMRMVTMPGVIVGARTLRNGRTDLYDEDWTRCFHPEGEPIRAWQVAYDLRIRPLYCLDHQIEHEAIEAPADDCPVCHSNEISMSVVSEALGIRSYQCDVCGSWVTKNA